jgi:protein-S-isoprenylcysteine O-methyltransferase Ste14
MQTIHAGLIPLLWLAWLAYWAIAAHGTKPTERVESGISRAAHMLPLAFAFWLLWTRARPGALLGGTIVPPSDALYFAGAVLVAIGLAFAIRARHYLGRNWSGVVTLKHDHELIRGGPYRLVRHPIYTGLLLAFVGSAIALDQWRGIAAVAIAWLALWAKLRVEERFMIERFGDAYRRFRAEVPALIPNPFRRGGGTPA